MKKLGEMRKRTFLALGLALLGCQAATVNAQELQDKFKNPSEDSKISVYSFWLNGHVSKSGLLNDYIAMKDAGIGGILLLNGGLYPAGFTGDVHYGSETWYDHVDYAMHVADSLGLKFGMHNCDGWSMSGGPWITVEKSQKTLTSAETTIVGGTKVNVKLPQPRFEQIYDDVAVLAYPKLTEVELATPKVVSVVGADKPEYLFDGKLDTKTSFVHRAMTMPEVVFDYGKVETINQVHFEIDFVGGFNNTMVEIAYSDDGVNYECVEGLFPLSYKWELEGVMPITCTFADIEARFVRLVFDMDKGRGTLSSTYGARLDVKELSLRNDYKVNLWQAKSVKCSRRTHQHMQQFMEELNQVVDCEIPAGRCVKSDEVVDVTRFVAEDGTLTWDAPAGEWTIVRMGYTSTGKHVEAASVAGRGYECDKLNPDVVREHFYAFTKKVDDIARELTGHSLYNMQMDSWEAGLLSWTGGFEKVFEERNGYSMLKWLPVLNDGTVVDSYEASNRFLYDFRLTVAERLAESYWGTMHAEAQKHGIILQSEATGMQQILYDPIRMMQHCDVPMGEFWTNEKYVRADCKSAASVANVFGKKKVSGEAFTSRGFHQWNATPEALKRMGDEAFCLGVNNFVLHCSVHQPYEIDGGISLSMFGHHFHRKNSWFGYMQGWAEYLQRSQSLLQEGRTVTDVCYFTGEGAVGYLGLRKELDPALPAGIDYDGVNLDIMKQMVVKNGRMTLESGVSFALMVVREQDKMTPELVSEIERLVSEGATIMVNKPSVSPSLRNYPLCDDEVQALADKVWGEDFDGEMVKVNAYGKGKVLWGVDMNLVLHDLKVVEDFSYTPAYYTHMADATLEYIHRRTTTEDIYFVSNAVDQKIAATCRFRVSDKVPQLWNPERGEIYNVPFVKRGAVTEINLTFDELESYFIVFSDKVVDTMDKDFAIAAKVGDVLVDNIWNVTFEGASELDAKKVSLYDWSASDNEDMKYYSGVAHYTNTFKMSEVKADRMYVIDLGQVGEIAVVNINGKKVANLWRAPYRVDVSKYLKKGANTIEVEVVSTLFNKIVGEDKRYETDVKYNAGNVISAMPEWLEAPEKRKSKRELLITYKYNQWATRPLQASGLIGPVTISEYK